MFDLVLRHPQKLVLIKFSQNYFHFMEEVQNNL